MNPAGSDDSRTDLAHRAPSPSLPKPTGLVVTVVVMLSAFAAILAACTPTSGSSDTDGSQPGFVSAISTDQRFVGVVNGRSSNAIVHTNCTDDTRDIPDPRKAPESPGGPTSTSAVGAALGFAAAGQTVSARLDPNGPGNTGDNGAVFVLPNTNAQFVQLRNWNEEVEFPTDIQIPCEGRGTIVFDPCFGFVGCRGDANRHVVQVIFEPSTGASGTPSRAEF